MSSEIFMLFLAAIGLLGLSVALHLFLFKNKNLSTRLLGGYTLLMTISFLEPLKRYSNVSIFLFEIIVATGAFMLGPMLYLYCKHRIGNNLRSSGWDLMHFIPAGVIMILTIFSPKPSKPMAEQTDEVVLYMLFALQVVAYTLLSLFFALKQKKRVNSEKMVQKFHITFVLFLVISSLILFLYSFSSTLLGLNHSFSFTLSIQALLTLLIIIIVLLNAETLEKHEVRNKTWH